MYFNIQDPAEADKLLKIQRELDETKIILVSSYIKVTPNVNNLIFNWYEIWVGSLI